jgi:molybdenum cofactor cytidylyltransferase
MICAMVLAAGLSRRMGVQKLLLPFGGKTVIAHIVDQIIESTVDETYVVVGHEGERVSRELSDRRISIVVNSEYESGMLSSVRCGLIALPQECRAVLVALGDQPSLTTKLLDQMVRSFKETEKKILVPIHNGRRGHPVMFSLGYRDEIMTRYDNVGLRGLLNAHPDDVFDLSVSTSSVLLDMDYPPDYQRELESTERENAGS